MNRKNKNGKSIEKENSFFCQEKKKLKGVMLRRRKKIKWRVTKEKNKKKRYKEIYVRKEIKEST